MKLNQIYRFEVAKLCTPFTSSSTPTILAQVFLIKQQYCKSILFCRRVV